MNQGKLEVVRQEAKRFPASSVLARAGAGCGSVGDVTGAWLASAPYIIKNFVPFTLLYSPKMLREPSGKGQMVQMLIIT